MIWNAHIGLLYFQEFWIHSISHAFGILKPICAFALKRTCEFALIQNNFNIYTTTSEGLAVNIGLGVKMSIIKEQKWPLKQFVHWWSTYPYVSAPTDRHLLEQIDIDTVWRYRYSMEEIQIQYGADTVTDRQVDKQADINQKFIILQCCDTCTG